MFGDRSTNSFGRACDNGDLSLIFFLTWQELTFFLTLRIIPAKPPAAKSLVVRMLAL